MKYINKAGDIVEVADCDIKNGIIKYYNLDHDSVIKENGLTYDILLQDIHKRYDKLLHDAEKISAVTIDGFGKILIKIPFNIVLNSIIKNL